MKKAAIITSYMENEISIKEYLHPGDYIICTDGGYDIALSQDISPDLLLGDFDSIKSELPENIEIKRFEPEKDYTDLDLAMRTAVEAGVTELKIFGGIGGRLDHTVANIQLLYHYNKFFKKLIMLDGSNKCFILDSEKVRNFVIPREKNSYLSVFSLSEKSTGVSISGAKYPLHDHTLTKSFPLGVSNEFTEKNTAISIKDGILLIVISKM